MTVNSDIKLNFVTCISRNSSVLRTLQVRSKNWKKVGGSILPLTEQKHEKSILLEVHFKYVWSTLEVHFKYSWKYTLSTFEAHFKYTRSILLWYCISRKFAHLEKFQGVASAEAVTKYASTVLLPRWLWNFQFLTVFKKYTLRILS